MACHGRSYPSGCRNCCNRAMRSAVKRVMAAMMEMVKIDVAALEAAADGR